MVELSVCDLVGELRLLFEMLQRGNVEDMLFLGCFLQSQSGGTSSLFVPGQTPVALSGTGRITQRAKVSNNHLHVMPLASSFLLCTIRLLLTPLLEYLLHMPLDVFCDIWLIARGKLRLAYLFVFRIRQGTRELS